MKCWVHLEDGIVKGLASASIPRDELARELGEWVLEGITPFLHDFGDEPARVNVPLPVARQSALAL